MQHIKINFRHTGAAIAVALVVFFAAGAFLTSCDDATGTNPGAVTGVTVSPASTSLAVGETLQLTARVTPATATDKTVTWSSGNENYATVDADGLVTAIAPGAVLIRATTTDGGKTAVCALQVATSTAVEEVQLDRKSLMLTSIGQTETLTATVLPEAANNKTVTWNSDYPAIASVSNDGTVTAISPGKAIITVTTDEGQKTETCNVLVRITLNLGTAGFMSQATWTVGGQIWSDEVTATGCQKEWFDSYDKDSNSYMSDCRSNGGYGDLFSWPAVVQYAQQLCPAPWRVPTANDFIDLDHELCGTTGSNGLDRTSAADLNKYINTWGAEYGGYCIYGSIGNQGRQAFYWTTYEHGSNPNYGIYQMLASDGTIRPWMPNGKHFGMMVRCVKDA